MLFPFLCATFLSIHGQTIISDSYVWFGDRSNQQAYCHSSKYDTASTDLTVSLGHSFKLNIFKSFEVFAQVMSNKANDFIYLYFGSDVLNCLKTLTWIFRKKQGISTPNVHIKPWFLRVVTCWQQLIWQFTWNGINSSILMDFNGVYPRALRDPYRSIKDWSKF